MPGGGVELAGRSQVLASAIETETVNVKGVIGGSLAEG